MNSIRVVTPRQFEDAHADVLRELAGLGLLDERVGAVEARLAAISPWYGWQYYGSGGGIRIPAVSLCRLRDWLTGRYVSVRDVLRHEYAHAIADTHRGLFRSSVFADAFGAPHGWAHAWEYDPRHHVTSYAATAPAEDFAEVFMAYVRHSGRLPRRHDTRPIRRKWRFVQILSSAIRSGRRRW